MPAYLCIIPYLRSKISRLIFDYDPLFSISASLFSIIEIYFLLDKIRHSFKHSKITQKPRTTSGFYFSLRDHITTGISNKEKIPPINDNVR